MTLSRGLTGVGSGGESTHMPGATRKLTVVAVLVVLAVLGGCIYTSCKPIRPFDKLESDAHKVITGPELQAWALALLERYRATTSLTVSQLGTNFPQQLRTLAPGFDPHVEVVWPPNANESPFVQVYWTASMEEGAGFV